MMVTAGSRPAQRIREMYENAGGARGPRQRARRRRLGLPFAALAGIALPIAACGGSISSGAAGASSSAATPAPPFLYVVNTKSDEVSQYSAPPSDSGALTPLAPSTVRTGPFPYGIAIDPQGNSLYVASQGSASAPGNDVSQYTIDQNTGRLTPKSPATVATGRGPVAIAVTPDGKSAYVVAGPNGIWQYNINPATGALTPKSPATVATGPNPEPIAVTPNGKYAYVANCPRCSAKPRNSPSASPPKPAANTIWEYRINQSTGALSPKPIAIAAIGTGANAIAITPNSKSLYIAINSVWQYSINPVTGKLTPKSPATVPAGGSAHDLAIEPDGKNIYVVTVATSTVSQYRINPGTGALSPKPVSTAKTVLHPEAITIAPNGESAYVTSENDGKISQYTINPSTGRITPMSPASVATGSGSLGIAITPGR